MVFSARSACLALFLFSILGGSFPALAENRALIIGVGAFADERLGTPAPVDGDIETMERLARERLGFATDEIKVLRGEEATKAAILQAIGEWLRPDRKEVEERREDEEKIRSGKLSRKQVRALRRKWRKAARKPKRSFLYFAGPGYFHRDLNGEEKDRMDETVIPYDAKVMGSGENAVITGMITDDEFSEAVASLEGRTVTVVMDTSHWGWVSRAKPPRAGLQATARVPSIHGVAREADSSSGMEAGDGAFIEASFDRGSLTVWAAVAPGQTALVDHSGAQPVGVFTKFYAEGLSSDAADANKNGYLSNAEQMVYVADKMAGYCAEHRSRCETGMVPVLSPASVFGRRAAPGKKRERKLSIRRFQDFLVRGEDAGLALSQDPPSPLRVGDTRLRFTAMPDRAGHLILLSLTDSGQLIQLYPNAAAGGTTRVEPGRGVVVPGESDDLQLWATDPAKGRLIAIFTPDAVNFGSNVTTRTIGDIPRSEAFGDYLPKLAAALARPVPSRSENGSLSPADWSVSLLPYEILPAEKPKTKPKAKTSQKAKKKQ